MGRVVSEYQERFEAGDFLVRNVVGFDPKTGAIAIGDYTTDGSGLGSVVLTAGDDAPRELQVERDGNRWRILPAR